MKTPIWILVLATSLAAAPSTAQESNDLLRALGLPRVTQEARVLGVPESDIRGILDTAREKSVTAGGVAELFQGENQAIREHGPIDNFGAFVQARLNDGLRGRELAAAIRAEHAAHGKGKGHAKAQGGGAEEVGKKNAAVGAGGKPESPGKSASAKSGSHGKPASSDKSESQDKPEAAKGKKGGPQ